MASTTKTKPIRTKDVAAEEANQCLDASASVISTSHRYVGEHQSKR
jgi:hypothetical protein